MREAPSLVLPQGDGYDDSLDVFGIHGAGGTLGAILAFSQLAQLTPSLRMRQ